MLTTTLITLLGVSCTGAAKLYVSTYGGNITTLSVSRQQVQGTCKESFNIRELAMTGECAENPSWLTLDQSQGILYCVGEGFAGPNGSLTSFETRTNGSLRKIAQSDTITGGVSAATYGSGALAIAH